MTDERAQAGDERMPLDEAAFEAGVPVEELVTWAVALGYAGEMDRAGDPPSIRRWAWQAVRAHLARIEGK